MQSEVQGAEATVDDHLRNLIQLMKRGGRVSVTDIPNDPTFLSSHFGGPTVQAMAEKLETALSAAEPVAWMITETKTSGSKCWKVVEHEYQAHEEARSWSNLLDSVKVVPVYAAPPAPSVAVKALEWHGSFGKSPVGQAVCYRVMFNDNGAGWGYPEKGRGYFAEQDSGFLVSGPHDTHAKAREAAQADYEARIRSALSAQVQDARSNDDEEIYEIGVREGYERAVQEIDMKTGGDGEYRYCTDHDPERHTPGPAEMIQRIVDRFETLNLLDEAEKRGDFWDAPGSAQVQDVAAWQSMDTAPKDGSEFAAGRRYSPDGEFVVHTYRWVGPPNYWNSKRNGVCIRPSYQDDYMWCPLPAAPAKQEGGE